ncbi:uncharacterized protein LOC129596342 [Paramacrobiotus metropolitanus]|uniref:uncharacterized protein LOC129596342 n=1 Tax=Paramacrobiotus metropolitanus TaxID=2943436 RepID=UPI0024458727|nr:uncharacterized protein LOC129596342 [Paramacrobiotus metropolitanus]
MMLTHSFRLFFHLYFLSAVAQDVIPNANCEHVRTYQYPSGTFLACLNDNLTFPDTFNVSAIGTDLARMDISCPTSNRNPCNVIRRNYQPFPRRIDLKEVRLVGFVADGERRIPLHHLLINLCMSIVELTVQESRIGYLDAEYFRGFEALAVLDLQNNDIAQITVDTFEGLVMPSHQAVLSKIDMIGNYLDVLDWSVFYPIQSSLKSLNMGQQITGLDEILMTGADFAMQLQELFLTHNNLTAIPSQVLQSLTAPRIYNPDQKAVYDFTFNEFCNKAECACCGFEDFMLWAEEITRFSADLESKVTVRVFCGQSIIDDMSVLPLDFFATCPSCSENDPRKIKCPHKLSGFDNGLGVTFNGDLPEINERSGNERTSTATVLPLNPVPPNKVVLTTGSIVGIAVACSIVLGGVSVLLIGWRRKARWLAWKPMELGRRTLEEEELVTELDSANSFSRQHGLPRCQHSEISAVIREKEVTDFEPEDYEVETLGCDCSYDYKTWNFLAQGSYGRVYTAKITTPGGFRGEDTVVVKVTHLEKNDELLMDNQNWLRLLARWRLLISLTYEHLVAYHKVSIIKQKARACVSVEFLMEFCSGGDLAVLLHDLKTTNTPLNRAQSLCYAIQITLGLEFLHKQRLVHGDLKPGNILLKPHQDRHHTALIGDLDSIVQMRHSTTSVSDMSNLRGTIRYMSPEMLRKFGGMECVGLGKATDIWSMGCIFHDLFDSSCSIRGRLLYKIDSADFTIKDNTHNATFAMKIMEGYAPRVSERMPEKLSLIVKQCLIVSSRERRSAELLIGDLQKLISEFVDNGDASLALEIDNIRRCICGSNFNRCHSA